MGILAALEINIAERRVTFLKVVRKFQAFLARQEVFVQNCLSITARRDRARNGFASRKALDCAADQLPASVSLRQHGAATKAASDTAGLNSLRGLVRQFV